MTIADEGLLPALGGGHLLAMVAAAWGGALLAAPVPPALGATAVALALLGRQRVLLVIALGALASGMGHRADAAFEPIGEGPYAAPVTVVDEAEPLGAGWRAVVRLDGGHRVEAIAFGPTGHRLARLGAGQEVHIEGRLAAVDDTPWNRARHVVGEVQVAEVGTPEGPEGVRGAVEAVRNAILAGADGLPAHQRPLYHGLVVGEDRLQSPAQQARFRAAGMSHLLAVSGQNVAFVLAVLAVPASLLGRRARLLVTLAVLAGFAVATRLEPSVLRATAMAALATWARDDGRDVDGLRMLALAATALILLDPFLVRSVGFQLSVAASASIIVGADRVAERLPLPGPIAYPTAVTVVAQFGVAPLLVFHFDAMPLASVPANIVGGWAAGVVMVLGLTVGPLSAAAPSPVDTWLQMPTSFLLWWLDAVAAWAVRLPLPWLDATGLAVSATVVSVAATVWWAVVRRWPVGRRIGAGLLVIVLAARIVLTVSPVPHPPAHSVSLPGGGRWYPAGPAGNSVLVVEAGADRRLLDALLRRRLTGADVVVAEHGSGSGAAIAAQVAELLSTGRIVAPRHHRIIGAHRQLEAVVVMSGVGPVRVEPDGDDRLAVSLVRGAP